jgi:hypothetical protein
VTVGSLSSGVVIANSFAVLGNLTSLDLPMEGCNDLNSTDVTEMEMQLSQSPCFVLANKSVSPNRKARLEKIEKRLLLILLSEPRKIKNNVRS